MPWMRRVRSLRKPTQAAWLLSIACLASAVLPTPTTRAGDDWSQWRGPTRAGVALESPPLLESLPTDGLSPDWRTGEIPSARDGGWGSPVIADGRAYLFVHERRKKEDYTPPEKKYPWLPPSKRTHMTDAEYQEYERNRRDEDFAIGTGGYEFIEHLYCFDLASGEELWKASTPSVYTRFVHSGTPAVADGRVYVLGAGRKAWCLDAATGEEQWRVDLPGEFRDEFMMSSFALADDVAVVLCGHLYALDADTGSIRWEGDPARTRGTHSSPVVWRSPVTGGRPLILCNVAGNETACFDPRSGAELWRVESMASHSTPVVVSGSVLDDTSADHVLTYGNSRKKGLRCFVVTPNGAQEEWAYQGLADKGSSPVVAGPYAYVQGENRLACVDLATGRAKWRTNIDVRNAEYSSPIAVDGKVIYAQDGLLMFRATPAGFEPLIEAKFDGEGLMAAPETHRRRLGLDADAGDDAEQRRQALRRYENLIGRNGPLRCASPAVAEGRLIVRFPDHLACYDLRVPTAAQSGP